MKKKFKEFLRKEGMLMEFEFNFKTHGFLDDVTMDAYLGKTQPDLFTSSGFDWNKTSRCEKNKADGQLFWNTLSHKWRAYMKKPEQRTSDRAKIMSAIQKYFDARKAGQTFYGFTLAEHCLTKAKCRNKYKATVIQYMNQMKRKGLLNYKCVHKEKSKYKKL